MAGSAVLASGAVANTSGVEATPHLDQAETSITYELEKLDPTRKLEFAVGTFALEGSAEKIPVEYKLVTPIGPDIGPTCNVSRTINGTATARYKLSVGSVKLSLGADGSTNAEIPRSAFETTAGFEENGSVVFRDYTIKDGKKNYNDSAGFCRNFIRQGVGAWALFNIDTLLNVYNRADSAINTAMMNEAIGGVKTCRPEQLDALAIQAVKAELVQFSDDNSKPGEVTIESGTVAPEPSLAPSKTVTYEGQDNGIKYTVEKVEGRLTWDKITCTAAPGVGAETTSSTPSPTTQSPSAQNTTGGGHG